MRQAIIDYIRSLKNKTFGVSDELPFTSGNVLYLKNLKKVYVAMPQTTNEQILAVLGNHGVFQEVLTVGAFFATDAKTLPSGYEDFVEQVKLAKNVTSDVDYFRREVDVTTSFEADVMVTEFEFRFTKLN